MEHGPVFLSTEKLRSLQELRMGTAPQRVSVLCGSARLLWKNLPH